MSVDFKENIDSEQLIVASLFGKTLHMTMI